MSNKLKLFIKFCYWYSKNPKQQFGYLLKFPNPDYNILSLKNVLHIYIHISNKYEYYLHFSYSAYKLDYNCKKLIKFYINEYYT